jgi:phage N-6-adenine-methyltransferase
MSLVGFSARNHPQQVAKASVDDRGTTLQVFEPLHERFGFTLDVAATPANAKLPRFLTALDDGLVRSWASERVWCNPPYSQIEPWVAKAALETGFGGDCELAVLLLPANRTEQGWWQRHIEPVRDRPGSGVCVEFLPGRMRFIVPPADSVRPNDRPPFGVCLAIFTGFGR